MIPFTTRRTLRAVWAATAILCAFPGISAAQCDYGMISLYVDAWFSPSQSLWAAYAEGEDQASGCCYHLYGSSMEATIAQEVFTDANSGTTSSVSQPYKGPGTVDVVAGFSIGCLCVNAIVASASVPAWIALPNPSVSVTTAAQPEYLKPTHFLALKSASEDVVFNAVLTPATTSPSLVSWGNSDGQQGANNLQRVVSRAAAGTFHVSATVGETEPSYTLHVIDAVAPPSAAPATKTPVFGGPQAPSVFCGALCFGQTYIDIGPFGITRPTFDVTPFFNADRWVFRLDWVEHVYQWGTKPSGFRINLPNGNPPSFPQAAGMTVAQSKMEAFDDFDTATPTAPSIGPRRRSYWVESITQAHELAHVNLFYTNFWQDAMDLFEGDVEGAAANVVYDCNNSTTVTGTAARALRQNTWEGQVTTRHTDAFNAHIFGGAHELNAHAVTNPQYAPIRGQIQFP